MNDAEVRIPDVPVKIQARDIPPSYATELGYLMYLEDNAPAHSEVRTQAGRVIRDFGKITERFNPETPEALYLLKMWTYATALARGISSRRAVRDERMRAAQRQWDLTRSQIASQEHWSNLMRGAWQVLLLGGLAFILLRFAAQKILGASGIAGVPGSNDVTTASLATTMAICLLNSYYKAWYTRRRIDKLGEGFDEQVSRAEREYVASARIEYNLCAAQSSEAWVVLTGEKPPEETHAFNVMIQGLVAEDQYGRDSGRGRKGTIIVRTVRTVRTMIRQVRLSRNDALKKRIRETDLSDEHF